MPAYLIGGLLDGCRDSLARMLENAAVPIQADLGPWNHDFPDTGAPGPYYDWRERATRWWNRWLRGWRTGLEEGPRFLVFVREAVPPDTSLSVVPGHWRQESWPLRGARRTRFYPSTARRLLERPGASGEVRLRYVPGSGTAAGDWWGELTGDMRGDDACSLTFDTPPLSTESADRLPHGAAPVDG